MSNNKQSSVEWLYEKLLHCELNILEWQKHLEQAKAMHKEEIMEAHYAPKYGCFSEEYYNSTFGGEQ